MSPVPGGSGPPPRQGPATDGHDEFLPRQPLSRLISDSSPTYLSFACVCLVLCSCRFWDNKQEKKHPWFMFGFLCEAPDGSPRFFTSTAFPVHQYYPTGLVSHRHSFSTRLLCLTDPHLSEGPAR